jgi:hypothetical protein
VERKMGKPNKKNTFVAEKLGSMKMDVKNVLF